MVAGEARPMRVQERRRGTRHEETAELRQIAEEPADAMSLTSRRTVRCRSARIERPEETSSEPRRGIRLASWVGDHVDALSRELSLGEEVPRLLQRPVADDDDASADVEDRRHVGDEIGNHLVTEQAPEVPDERGHARRVSPKVAQPMDFAVHAEHLRCCDLRDEVVRIMWISIGEIGNHGDV